MGFADYYFERFQCDNPQIQDQPADDLFLACIIPAYNEKSLSHTLHSISDAEFPKQSAEIIVVINQSEKAPEEHKRQNEKTFEEAKALQKHFSRNIRLHVLFYGQMPHKHAGVGLARKKGMDEALHRFNSLNKSAGLITCTDADCTLDKNYFTSLEKYFGEHPETNGVSLHFEHRLNDKNLSPEDLQRIVSYELHLRYYNQALRYIKFPPAFQTIGSSFAVKAESYAKQGGMNRKKAGEDFYFLQKIITAGNFHDFPYTTVYPSGRGSNRVPFGTGAAVEKMRQNRQTQYLSYAWASFLEIKELISRPQVFFKYNTLTFDELGECTKEFLKNENFAKALRRIKRISNDLQTFRKHFFAEFNAFKMVKYLNFSQRHYFPARPVVDGAARLAALLGFPEENSESDLLTAYREFERQNPKKT